MQVKLIRDSIANGIRICTFVLVYPRFIHSEFLKHRVLTNNAASSRAIPTKAIIQNLRDDPAEIIWWGKNMSGMQAKEELSGIQLRLAKFGWATARELMILCARFMNAIGLHKQIANRVLEPFQNIRTVTTGTEWNNFMALRNHPDAQPEFQLLASMMKSAMDSSKPEVLQSGDWHIPYVKSIWANGVQLFQIETSDGGIASKHILPVSLEEALKISASMAAQESYRKSDPSLEKAEAIWERLVGQMPVHASPTEHQAQAMEIHNTTRLVPNFTEKNEYIGAAGEYMFNTSGVTHMDSKGNFWSGNFRGYLQHRQLISNHDVKG
jgi:hypothetical protein